MGTHTFALIGTSINKLSYWKLEYLKGKADIDWGMHNSNRATHTRYDLD